MQWKSVCRRNRRDRTAGTRLRVLVADDGVGVSDEVGETIFEHGYTTSPEGTGIGLSIVDRIATAHGWERRFSRSESGGCRFGSYTTSPPERTPRPSGEI